MKDTLKDKPRVKKIEEILNLKANQGVLLHEGCHILRER